MFPDLSGYLRNMTTFDDIFKITLTPANQVRRHLSHLSNAGRRVEAGIVHQVGYFVGNHFFSREWLIERLQLFRVMQVVAQPEGEGVGVKDHRHAVMDWCYEFVCSSGQDCEGFKIIAVRRFPCLPQSGQTHGCLIGDLDVVGLFLIVSVRPFVKP